MTDGPSAVCAATGEASANARSVGAWVGAACVRERLGGAGGGYIMSDAPELVTHLTSRGADGAATSTLGHRLQHSGGLLQERDAAAFLLSGPVIGEQAALKRARLKTTRSWNVGPAASLLPLAVDYFIGGLASEVQETHRSSFTNPIVARSLCVHTRRPIHDPASGACPSFHRIFVRDMVNFFDTGPNRELYECFRLSLPLRHPCKPLRHPRACREAFVQALELGSQLGSPESTVGPGRVAS